MFGRVPGGVVGRAQPLAGDRPRPYPARTGRTPAQDRRARRPRDRRPRSRGRAPDAAHLRRQPHRPDGPPQRGRGPGDGHRRGFDLPVRLCGTGRGWRPRCRARLVMRSSDGKRSVDCGKRSSRRALSQAGPTRERPGGDVLRHLGTWAPGHLISPRTLGGQGAVGAALIKVPGARALGSAGVRGSEVAGVSTAGSLAEADWEAHRPAVFGAAYRILGSLAEAEDVAHLHRRTRRPRPHRRRSQRTSDRPACGPPRKKDRIRPPTQGAG